MPRDITSALSCDHTCFHLPASAAPLPLHKNAVVRKSSSRLDWVGVGWIQSYCRLPLCPHKQVCCSMSHLDKDTVIPMTSLHLWFLPRASGSVSLGWYGKERLHADWPSVVT